jgi:hypothetical protein
MLIVWISRISVTHPVFAGRWKVFQARTFTFSTGGSRLAEEAVSLGGNLLTLAAGVVLSLLLLETFLRIFPYVALSTSQRRELAWRATHKTAEQVLTRKWYSFDRYSPELGWELTPNLRTPGLNSNSKGLRGTQEYALEPPTSVRRVLCIGDSFMFGEKLTDEQTLPAQLEAILNRAGRWEVLNLADHGYGTDQQWLRLEHLGFQYHADFVVLGFFEEDLGTLTVFATTPNRTLNSQESVSFSATPQFRPPKSFCPTRRSGHRVPYGPSVPSN